MDVWSTLMDCRDLWKNQNEANKQVNDGMGGTKGQTLHILKRFKDFRTLVLFNTNEDLEEFLY